MSNKGLGVLYICITALLWSFIGLLSKYCLLNGINPIEISFLRSFFGFLCFFVHCLFVKTISISWKDRICLILFGFWGIGVYYSLAQMTILLAGASMDIILQYTAPFWVALFSKILFKDYLNRLQVFSMILAGLGAVCVCLSGGSLPEKAPLLGIFTGLVTGICYASHYLFTRFWQKKYCTSVIFMYMLAGGTVALLACNLFSLHSPRTLLTDPLSISLFVWLAAASIGIFCTYLAFIFFGLALKKIGLVQAVITSEIEPVFSLFWVWIGFGESFSSIGWVGCVLIILSVLFLSLARNA